MPKPYKSLIGKTHRKFPPEGQGRIPRTYMHAFPISKPSVRNRIERARKRSPICFHFRLLWIIGTFNFPILAPELENQGRRRISEGGLRCVEVSSSGSNGSNGSCTRQGQTFTSSTYNWIFFFKIIFLVIRPTNPELAIQFNLKTL